MDILSSFESIASRCLLSINGKKQENLLLLKEPVLPHEPLISFCTACMGRLHHLKQTLPRNLEDNQDYPNVEFVLLNYNSKDGMDAWVKDVMAGPITQGKIKYIKTDKPRYFHMAHAKNVTHRRALGHIVCNLDADNFTGRGFARFLANAFISNRKQVIQGDLNVYKSSSGRVAVLKEYFMMVGGYDERMQGWGFEEQDLVRRLRNLGLQHKNLGQQQFLQTIEHDGKDRTECLSPQWRNRTATHRRNRILSWSHLASTQANQGKSWGVIND